MIARADRQRLDALHGIVQRVGPNDLIAIDAVDDAEAGENQAKLGVDFRDRAERRAVGAAVIGGGGDADCRRQTVEPIGVGFRERAEQTPGFSGECFDIARTAFGEQRIEGERAFSGPRNARDGDQRAEWEVEVDRLEVVCANASQADGSGRDVGGGHESTPFGP